jgi:hypothetical protein
MWWSWILTAVGVTGLYLAGRHNKIGWAIGLGAQLLWVAYAISTKQYGFLVSATAYGWVYATNLRKWMDEKHTEKIRKDMREEYDAERSSRD